MRDGDRLRGPEHEVAAHPALGRRPLSPSYARRPTTDSIVLAAADPLALDPAPVRFAASVAGRMGARLTVAAVVGDDGAASALAAGQNGEELVGDAAFALEQAVRMARAEGVEAESLSISATSAPRGIALTANVLGAELVVVGSGDGGPRGQVRPGRTAERLLNGSPAAIALVPAGWAQRDFDAIGAGFVDSAEGRSAVSTAHAHARRSGARLRVLAAVRPRAWSRTGADELRAQAEAAAAAAVSGFTGAPVDVDVSVAEPAELLVAVSGELDLLVCGTRGYGPRPAALLGGVTRALCAQARCPVIVLSGS